MKNIQPQNVLGLKAWERIDSKCYKAKEEDNDLVIHMRIVADFFQHGIKRMTFTSRHGFNSLIKIFIVDEEGIDKIGWSNDVLTNHSSDRCRLAVATRACSLEK